MHPKLHERMLSEIESLRNLVGQVSLEEAALHCYFAIGEVLKSGRGNRLLAPLKQCMYLLGLMLTTPEPERPVRMSMAQWEQIHQLLSNIFFAYADMYWPSPEELLESQKEIWRRPREVAMPAFLHYFTQGVLASAEQLSEKGRQILTPFDAVLEEELGLSATDAIRITHWITERIQTRLDRFMNILLALKRHHERFFTGNRNLERARREVATDPDLAGAQRDLGGLKEGNSSVSCSLYTRRPRSLRRCDPNPS
jgi:hypothetical protein